MLRVFRKDNSVFEPWKEDTDLTLQLACESDLGVSRLNKVIKDSTEKSQVFDFILDKFSELKLLFLQYACHNNYPYVSTHALDLFALNF